jgi:hypothetical protein
MLKALAVLRTVFLVFIVGFTVRALPWGWTRTFDEEFARCTATRAIALQAAWMAVAWIAFDTIVSWWLASRASRRAPEPLPAMAPPPERPAP